MAAPAWRGLRWGLFNDLAVAASSFSPLLLFASHFLVAPRPFVLRPLVLRPLVRCLLSPLRFLDRALYPLLLDVLSVVDRCV